jgi:hypothetical protein
MLLKVLDVRGNELTSLDGLCEGLTSLHELYMADNRLSSLQGLSDKAPALELLVCCSLCVCNALQFLTVLHSAAWVYTHVLWMTGSEGMGDGERRGLWRATTKYRSATAVL